VKSGFKNVKLEVVEGVRPEAGHWPLPAQTEVLLGWCDSLTAATPWSLLRSATALVVAEEPSLVRAADVARRAKALAKKLPKEEREKAEADVAAVLDAADAIATAHIDAIRAAAPPFPYSPTTLHFVTARVWCEGTEPWKAFEKGDRLLAKEVTAHEKIARPAREVIERAATANMPVEQFRASLKLWRDAFLAREGVTAAATRLDRWMKAPPAGIKPEEVAAYEEERERRAMADRAARAKIVEVRAAALEKLAEKFPGLFPKHDD
jgi:hypothetical protein